MTLATRILCIACRTRETDGGLQCATCLAGRNSPEQREQVVAAPSPAPAAPVLERPTEFRITLPWPLLISDNRHRGPVTSPEDARHYARVREAVRAFAKVVAGDDAPCFTGSVELTAHVWVPDRRVRDVENFAKCTRDGFEQAAYLNDNQVKRSTWEEAGVDAKYPRAEITVRPLE